MEYVYNPVTNSFKITDSPNKESMSFLLPQLVWVITDKCYYHCPFCFQPKTNTEVAPEKIDQYISLMKFLGVRKVDISGGEPMYYKKLVMVISELLRNGIGVTLSTNGSGLISNKKWIAENSTKLSRIIVSLNGHNEEQVDSLCGKKGAYKTVMSFFDLLSSSNCKNLRVNTVLTSALITGKRYINLAGTIKAINPNEWCLIEPNPDNKLPTFDEYSIDTDIFKKVVNEMKDRFSDTSTSVISRSIQNYAGYWILNPNGTIMLHTDGTCTPVSIPFTLSNLPLLEKRSIETGIWVPAE